MNQQYEFYRQLSFLILICGGVSMMYGGYSLGNVLTSERVLLGFLDNTDEIELPQSDSNELNFAFLMLKIFSIIPIGVGIILIIFGYKLLNSFEET